MSDAQALVKFVNDDSVQARVKKLLDRRASQFTTSLITIANSNDKIAKCKPSTVVNAALTAASMDLPINQNLGFAYIIPYGSEAQFQMGWKGFIQLAQRSGKYQTIAATPVFEGQIKTNDPLRGMEFDWSVKPEKGVNPAGYAAFFRLTNGFEKTLYMSMEEMKAHAERYSKSYKTGPWKDNFEAMAQKTVLKLLISRFGPMSTEIERALDSDQAVIDDKGRRYVDNDLDDVGADDDKKNAIIDAHTDEDDSSDTDEVPPKDKSKAKKDLKQAGLIDDDDNAS